MNAPSGDIRIAGAGRREYRQEMFLARMIARGFGWTTKDVETPQQLGAALGSALAAGGPQFIRIRAI